MSADQFGQTERTFRLKHRAVLKGVSVGAIPEFVYSPVEVNGFVGEWAWIWDDTGEFNSPIFGSAKAARDWMDERTKGQFVVQTQIEQPA